MNTVSTMQDRLKSRSIGLKLIVVCGLALLMTIPALFVGGLIEERTSRQSSVIREIAQYVGGQQTFLGPTLAVPYTVPATENASAQHCLYLVFPATPQPYSRRRLRSDEDRCS